MTQFPHMAFDPPDLIGRDEEKAAIVESILAIGMSRVIVLLGRGGTGKTRLLLWAAEQCKEHGLLCSDVVDLYHSDTRTSLGIERAILCGPFSDGGRNGTQKPGSARTTAGLDPMKEIFAEYWRKRSEFEKEQEKDVARAQLEIRQTELTELFIETYNRVAEAMRIAILIDTTELIQYESPHIRSVLGFGHDSAEVKEWLINVLPRLRNTSVFLGGRAQRDTNKGNGQNSDPRKLLWDDIRLAVGVHMDWTEYELKGLKREDVVSRYFIQVANAIGQQVASADEAAAQLAAANRPDEARKFKEHAHALEEKRQDVLSLTYEEKTRIWQLAGGLPITLGLLLDHVMWVGHDILFNPVASLEDSDEKMSVLYQRLVREDVRELGYPISDALYLLAVARRGLDAELLQRLCSEFLHKELTREECIEYLYALQSFSFVKARPGTGQVFLHDELADVLDEKLIGGASTYVPYFKYMAEYYQRICNDTTDRDQRIDATISRIHYALRYNSDEGYEQFQQEHDRAVRDDHSELANMLRDEVQRHYESVYFKFTPARRTYHKADVERDDAIIRMKYLLTTNRLEETRTLAYRILSVAPDLYRNLLPDQIPESLTTENIVALREMFRDGKPVFWSELLMCAGEAMVYVGEPEDKVEPILVQGIKLLEDGERR